MGQPIDVAPYARKGEDDSESDAISFALAPADQSFEPEGYKLEVTHGGVRVTARTPAGLLYGAVTLWQLMTIYPTQGGVAVVPAVEIRDAPRFAVPRHRDEIDYLRSLAQFKNAPAGFFEYLTKLRFTGDLFALPEGTPVFANEPIAIVRAPNAFPQAMSWPVSPITSTWPGRNSVP